MSAHTKAGTCSAAENTAFLGCRNATKDHNEELSSYRSGSGSTQNRHFPKATCTDAAVIIPVTGPATPPGSAAAQGAIAEAAFMTGLERNSDAVAMAAYAPLFVNDARGFRAWPTNLIVFDSTRYPARLLVFQAYSYIWYFRFHSATPYECGDD